MHENDEADQSRPLVSNRTMEIVVALLLLGGAAIVISDSARIGFGCNIGAFVGGVASGSLHGWIWLAAAFAGSYVGIALRPWFGLSRD